MTIISSGIYPINPTVTDGTQLAGYINELVEAINSQQASPTRPPLITKGGLWTKTLTGDDIAVMVYDGSVDLEVAKVVDGKIVGVSLWENVDGVTTSNTDVVVNGVRVGMGGGAYSIPTNTAMGLEALQSNISGSNNTAFGENALFSNETGSANTAFGREALKFNKDGGGNTAVGVGSLLISVSGTGNTSIGYASQKNNEGQRNTTVGYQTMEVATLAAQNTGVGWNALSKTTSASINTAVGDSALLNLTEGSENQAFGNEALTAVTIGSSNTAVGRSAGSELKSGSNNLILGYKAQASAEGVNNEVTIGNDDVETTRLKGNVTVGASSNAIKLYGMGTGNSEVTGFEGTFNVGNTYEEGNLNLISGNQVAAIIDKNQFVTFNNGVTTQNLNVNGAIYIPSVYTNITENPSNVFVNDLGELMKSTATFYTTKEVDGLVNGKDKVINELTKRLDDLELKFKALGSTKKSKK